MEKERKRKRGRERARGKKEWSHISFLLFIPTIAITKEEKEKGKKERKKVPHNFLSANPYDAPRFNFFFIFSFFREREEKIKNKASSYNEIDRYIDRESEIDR